MMCLSPYPQGAGRVCILPAFRMCATTYLRKRIKPEEASNSSIVVVIELLVLIMQDQVQKYGNKRMRVAFIGKDQKDKEFRDAVYCRDYERTLPVLSR